MTSQVKTLDALTGLRFIAALAVFVHHVSGRFSIPDVKLPMGAHAVSFFFVLSGFILTYVYSTRLKWGNVGKFYFTRWARIWPLHIACLLLLLGFLYNLRQFDNDPQHWSKLFANVFLLQSWIPNNPYAFGFNGVSWSISTELFFYIMFPLFLLGGQKQFWYKYVGLLLVTAGLVAGVTMVSHTNWFPNVDYTRLGHTFPLLRLPEFCTGMAIGFIYLNREKVKEAATSVRPRSFAQDTILEFFALSSIVGHMLLIRWSNVILHIKSAEWGGEFLSSFAVFTSGCFIFAAVIYLFSKSTGLIAWFCSTRAMVFLGEVSFAFYMIHQIIIRLVLKHYGDYFELPPVVLATLIGLLSLTASIVLFKVVEMPCKNGLLALYNRKWVTGLSTVPKAVGSFVGTRLFIFSLLLTVASVIILSQYKTKVLTSSQVKEIIKTSDPEFQRVKFDRSMELLGYNIKVEKKGWRFALAWKKYSQFSHSRYVHVCDANGNIVGHGPRDEKRFRNAKVGERFADSFFIPKKKLAEGVKIGIGFHSKGIGMMKVNQGSRSMNGRRLDLVPPEKFAKLTASQQQGEGKSVTRVRKKDETIER